MVKGESFMKKIKTVLLFLLCALMLFTSVACGNDAPVAHVHKTVHRSGKAATCTETGKLEHWICVTCDKYFADKECANEIKEYEVITPKASHTPTHHEGVEATEMVAGNIEYWSCDVCEKLFSDNLCKSEIKEEDTVLYSLATLVDFVVEVPEDRNPIVLQLADPQLMDSETMKEGRLGDAAAKYWTFNKNTYTEKGGEAGLGKNELCYDFIAEIVEKTKAKNNGNLDLILVTGDVIYGEFDPDGHMLTDFVNFMETLNIKWVPIMGNHDVESLKGADWMCEQYENAQNCLFKQGDVEGNGNFTVGIKQGNKLKRVFYNMDTNGCTGASTASKMNGHTVTRENNDYGKDIGVYGLQQDQIKWLTKSVEQIKSFVPNVKISLHIHIPMKYFGVAFNEKYKGLTGQDPVAQVEVERGNYTVNGVNTEGRILYLDRVVGHGAGDFGWLTSLDGWTPDYWDIAATNDAIPGATGDHAIFYQIKALGTDSIFVGHYHTINASMVYEGIRFQFGQKCSLYDNVAQLLSNNKIASAVGYSYNTGATLLVGGTVIPIDKDSGELLTPYTQYCEGHGEEVNWASFKDTITRA